MRSEAEVSTSINLNLDIRIPEDYIGDSSQRLRMYKRISSAVDREELDTLRQELIDRFGKYPESVEHLFLYAELRQNCDGAPDPIDREEQRPGASRRAE